MPTEEGSADYGESAANKGRRHFLSPRKVTRLHKKYGDGVKNIIGIIARALSLRGAKCKNKEIPEYGERFRVCPITSDERLGALRGPPYYCHWCPLNKNPRV